MQKFKEFWSISKFKAKYLPWKKQWFFFHNLTWWTENWGQKSKSWNVCNLNCICLISTISLNIKFLHKKSHNSCSITTTLEIERQTLLYVNLKSILNVVCTFFALEASKYFLFVEFAGGFSFENIYENRLLQISFKLIISKKSSWIYDLVE